MQALIDTALLLRDIAKELGLSSGCISMSYQEDLDAVAFKVTAFNRCRKIFLAMSEIETAKFPVKDMVRIHLKWNEQP